MRIWRSGLGIGRSFVQSCSILFGFGRFCSESSGACQRNFRLVRSGSGSRTEAGGGQGELADLLRGTARNHCMRTDVLLGQSFGTASLDGRGKPFRPSEAASRASRPLKSRSWGSARPRSERGPPSACGSFPHEETFAKLLFSPLRRPLNKSPSPPLRGRCRRQRGGSPSQGLSGRWRRTPPLSLRDISPRKGGERGIMSFSKVSARVGIEGCSDMKHGFLVKPGMTDMRADYVSRNPLN